MALPFAKLALMGVKIITKPIANSVKAEAKRNDTFKQYCISLGRFLNRTNVAFNNRLLGRKPTSGSKTYVLREKDAIERGADAVGEVATFFLVAGPVIGVYWYENDQKEKSKAAQMEKERAASAEVDRRFGLLQTELVLLRAELQATLAELSHQNRQNTDSANNNRRDRNNTSSSGSPPVDPPKSAPRQSRRWWGLGLF